MLHDWAALDLPDYRQLLTGHFTQGPEYFARRRNGTSDWLLIMTLAGAGRFGPPAQPLEALPGRIVLLRPGLSHDYGTAEAAGQWELLWVHFHPRPHWHDWLAWPPQPHGPMTLDMTGQAWEEAQECFWRLHRRANEAIPHGRDLAMTSLEELLLRCHSTILAGSGRTDERITALLTFLNTHLAEPHSLTSLAAHALMSPSHLSHLFRRQVGISPMQYLDIQRMERAKQLLIRTTGSIGQIANEIGLDAIYFSLRFKQHTGLSPRAYRARHSAP